MLEEEIEKRISKFITGFYTDYIDTDDATTGVKIIVRIETVDEFGGKVNIAREREYTPGKEAEP